MYARPDSTASGPTEVFSREILATSRSLTLRSIAHVIPPRTSMMNIRSASLGNFRRSI